MASINTAAATAIVAGTWAVLHVLAGRRTAALEGAAREADRDLYEERTAVVNEVCAAARRAVQPRAVHDVLRDVGFARNYELLGLGVDAYSGKAEPPPIPYSVREPVWWYGGDKDVSGAIKTSYYAKKWENGPVAWCIHRDRLSEVVVRPGDLVYSVERNKSDGGWWDDGTLDVSRAEALEVGGTYLPLIRHAAFGRHCWAMVGTPQTETTRGSLLAMCEGILQRPGRTLRGVVVAEVESFERLLEAIRCPTAEVTQVVRWNLVMASTEKRAQGYISAARNAGMEQGARQFLPGEMVDLRNVVEQAARAAERRSGLPFETSGK